jgi:membrane associated rhomboid family serine protease
MSAEAPLDDPLAPIAVARTRKPKVAREYGLVLAAMGIEAELRPAPEGIALLVAPEHSARAVSELRQYELENRGWRRAEELPQALAESWPAVLVWLVVLMTQHAFSAQRAFGLDWWEQGGGRAGAVRSGEWWRTVTALGLHADALHLFGNLVFGALFVALVVELFGTGLGLFAVVGAGALANLANSWLQEPAFRSIGASTAVFAALGLLGGHRWQQRALVRSLRRASWIPLVAAAFLLAYLGSGGTRELGVESRVDVTGHALGFAVGAALGALYARLAPKTLSAPRFQPWFAAAALALWCAAWLAAFQR